MRVFANDMLKSMMGKLGMPEDEAIEHKFISRALETAQEKIEGFNFDSRKHVLEFDDIINHQRTSIYNRRRALLLGSIDDVEMELNHIIDSANSIGGEQDMSVLKEVITKKIAEYNREAFFSAVRIILLQTIDMYWVEHLEVMDYTRSSVNLRAYGQRDPLVEYKKEGQRLFKEMQNAMREQVIKIIPHIVPVQNGVPVNGGSSESGNSKNSIVNSKAGGIQADLKEVHENAQIIGAGDGSNGGAGGAGGAKKGDEVGRNDPCPCGSGKKYKKCHGAQA
jgi:preprotein translocase subunit SecA